MTREEPSNAENLSYHILKIALTYEFGIYHFTRKIACSWFDYAKNIVV